MAPSPVYHRLHTTVWHVSACMRGSIILQEVGLGTSATQASETGGKKGLSPMARWLSSSFQKPGHVA